MVENYLSATIRPDNLSARHTQLWAQNNDGAIAWPGRHASRDKGNDNRKTHLNKIIKGILQVPRIASSDRGVFSLLLAKIASTPLKAPNRPTKNNNKCGKFLSVSPRSLGENIRMNRIASPNITKNDRLANDSIKYLSTNAAELISSFIESIHRGKKMVWPNELPNTTKTNKAFVQKRLNSHGPILNVFRLSGVGWWTRGINGELLPATDSVTLDWNCPLSVDSMIAVLVDVPWVGSSNLFENGQLNIREIDN